MPTFRYRAVSGGSAATIDAPDRASAVRELMRVGVTPSEVEQLEADATAPERSVRVRRGRVMSKGEFASFIRELATALSAGLPMVVALRTMQQQGRNEAQRQMLSTLINGVEGGKSLAEAAKEWGAPFDDLTVNLLVAGEASGKLETVLTQAAELLDAQVRVRRSVLAATMYPMILAGLVTVAVIVMVTVIVPRILAPIEGQVLELPWPTRVVKGIAAFFGGYWWLILPIVGAVIVGVQRLLAQPGPRLWVDTRVLRLPVMGRLIRDLAVARFSRTLGTLTAAGIPALQALRITRGSLGNTAMEQVIDEVCEKVAAGKTIADPMERSRVFPPLLIQIVSLGERSGRLDEVLNQAAGAFEERSQASVKLLLTVLPPMLVVVLAAVVGFVVLAVILPLLEFQEALL